MGKCTGRKSIFITGAASGIGRATAKLFAERSWYVGLFDIDRDGLDQAIQEIGEDNCLAGILDVRNRAEWDLAVEAFSKATDGRMTVLFNNAGIGRHGWFEDVPADDNDTIIDVNLKGVINGVQAALPLLKQTPGSRIVNTASVAGVMGAPQLAVYSATKFAVRGLTEALDVEFSSLGIRVVSLMPWFIDTPILEIGNKAGANETMKEQLRKAGQDVYPVELAAERAWDAAHGKATHYMAGKQAERVRILQRFMPGMLKKQLVKALPTRS